jgi:predicted transport protein
MVYIKKKVENKYKDITFAARFDKAFPETVHIYEQLKSYALNLCEKVEDQDHIYYRGFYKNRTFLSVIIKKSEVLCYLPIDPATINLDKSYMRNMNKLGHWGTGSLEIRISSIDCLEQITPLILKAYLMS